MMRAFVLHRYGREGASMSIVPRPEPGPGEVLVAVHATGLNPVDHKTRDGAMRPLGLHRLPVVLGNELSGVVADRHGTATRFAVGDRVCVRTPVETMGAFADVIAIDESLLSPIPNGVDDLTAATLPLVGVTAWQALHDVAQVREGERVFVGAGAGGVGGIAIQLAKLVGAFVATTASEAGFDLVRSLGADQVVDYRRESPGDVLEDFDVAIDPFGGRHLGDALRTLHPGGRLVSLSGPPDPDTRFGSTRAPAIARAALSIGFRRTQALARRHGVEYHYLFMRPDAPALDRLLALAAQGSLRIPQLRSAPAEELPALLAELEQGHTKGKLAVTWNA